MNNNSAKPELDWGRVASFIVLLVILGVISVMSFRVMRGFLLPLFLAALIVVIFRPVHNFILEKTNQRKRLAAIVTTVLVGLIVQVPISWAVILAIKQGAQLTTRKWDIAEGLDTIRQRLGLSMPYKQELEQIDDIISKLFPSDPESQIAPTVQLPSEESLGQLQTLTKVASNLQSKLDENPDNTKPKIVAARQELNLVKESLDQAFQSARTIVVEDPNSSMAAENYSNAIHLIGIRFGSLRDDLLGGFPRSHLLRFANPSQNEIEQWQAKLGGYLSRKLLSLTGSIAVLGNMLFGIAIMLVSVYYFLIDGPAMIKTVMRLSPLDDVHEEELFAEFAKVSRAVVLATLLSAVAQGALAGIGYFFAGLDSLMLLTVLTTMLAMVPFVGAAAVWLPISVYLMFIAEGRMAAGIGLGIYGFAVVSMADNFVKPFILHGQSNLHPLLALLSVLGGVQALGPIGILVGPMLVAFLQALLNMLRREISTMSGSAA